MARPRRFDQLPSARSRRLGRARQASAGSIALASQEFSTRPGGPATGIAPDLVGSDLVKPDSAVSLVKADHRLAKVAAGTQKTTALILGRDIGVLRHRSLQETQISGSEVGEVGEGLVELLVG